MAKKKKPDKPTEYIEAVAELDTGDVVAAAGLWNLHVRITCEGEYWFAQGYEIDYAAEGNSIDDVKLRFQCGLSATIQEYLKIFGTATKLLVPASAEVWQALEDVPGSSHTYNQVGAYKFDDPSIQESLPYSAIEYFTAGPVSVMA